MSSSRLLDLRAIARRHFYHVHVLLIEPSSISAIGESLRWEVYAFRRLFNKSRLYSFPDSQGDEADQRLPITHCLSVDKNTNIQKLTVNILLGSLCTLEVINKAWRSNKTCLGICLWENGQHASSSTIATKKASLPALCAPFIQKHFATNRIRLRYHIRPADN